MSTASEIIARVSKTLVDESQTRWDEAELLGYVSDAQKEVALLKPNVYARTVSLQLVPGSLQAIPGDGTNLIDVKNNKGLDGTTDGSSVKEIEKSVLETWDPDWRAMTPNASAQHYLYDDRAPTVFEVYPPQPNPAGYVEIYYCAVPPTLTATTDTLVVPEIYDTAMYYFCLSRAFAKSTSTQDFAKSLNYKAQAQQLVTGRAQVTNELHPEMVAERVKR